MDTDLGPTVGPTVITGSDAGVVDDLVRAAASTTPVISVSPGQPPTSRAAVLVSGHPDGWIRAAAEVEHTWGLPRTVIVSPAPVARSGLADLAGAGWQAALGRNLGVATEVCRAFAPGLATRSPASIVIVTWQHARGPGTAHLAAVAGAVRLFALSLAADLGANGITVNAVAVAEDDVAAAWPAVRLLSSPDAGYLTAEVFTARSTTGTRP